MPEEVGVAVRRRVSSVVLVAGGLLGGLLAPAAPPVRPHLVLLQGGRQPGAGTAGGERALRLAP